MFVVRAACSPGLVTGYRRPCSQLLGTLASLRGRGQRMTALRRFGTRSAYGERSQLHRRLFLRKGIGPIKRSTCGSVAFGRLRKQVGGLSRLEQSRRALD